jgi:hypothetical protein
MLLLPLARAATHSAVTTHHSPAMEQRIQDLDFSLEAVKAQFRSIALCPLCDFCHPCKVNVSRYRDALCGSMDLFQAFLCHAKNQTNEIQQLGDKLSAKDKEIVNNKKDVELRELLQQILANLQSRQS